jgi:hypothetical protein
MANRPVLNGDSKNAPQRKKCVSDAEARFKSVTVAIDIWLVLGIVLMRVAVGICSQTL